MRLPIQVWCGRLQNYRTRVVQPTIERDLNNGVMHMSRRLLVLFLCFFLSAMLAGCGFHLRGQGKAGLAPELSVLRVRLDGENVSATELRREVARALNTQSDVRIAAETESTIPVLTLYDEQSNSRVLSYDEDRNVSEFLLRYRVDFDVRSPAGEKLVKRQTIILQRDYTFDRLNVLAKEKEEQELREQMRQEAVQQMIRRLAAWSS